LFGYAISTDQYELRLTQNNKENQHENCKNTSNAISKGLWFYIFRLLLNLAKPDLNYAHSANQMQTSAAVAKEITALCSTDHFNLK
jgi:hypothetical protein